MRTPQAKSPRCWRTCAPLQRQHHLAVLVVHHARKSAGSMRAGQALRGSSEFHAWGDSNLYLRRSGSEINLTVEHRAAPSPPSIAIELAQRGDALALEVVQSTAAQSLPPSSVDERIVSALSDSDHPVPIAELRSLCRVRKATLYARLAELVTTGRLVRCGDGYRLAATA